MSMWENLPSELWPEIFKHLPHSDLQQVRLVNSTWRDIADLPKLRRSTRLRINNGNIMQIMWYLNYFYKDRDYCPLAVCTCISVYNCQQYIDILERLFAKIGPSIEILIVTELQVLTYICDDGLPKLDTLMTIYPDENSLYHLHFLDFRLMPRMQYLYLDTLCQGEQALILRSLLDCADILKLRELRIQFRNETLEKFLIDVLKAYSSSLTSLELGIILKREESINYNSWKTAFKSMHKLNSMRLYKYCPTKFIDMVLDSLPATAPLKKISMDGQYQLTNKQVERMLQKWPKSLKSLDIVPCPEYMDHGLRSLKFVKDNLQSLNLSNSRHISRDLLLECLSCLNEKTMRSLYLDNVMCVDEMIVCRVAEQFRGLEVLSLNSCFDAVTNYSMSHILRYLTDLQYLSIECDLVTDEGFLGTEAMPYAITRLSRLHTLQLGGCVAITHKAFQIIKLPYLRNLSFGYSSVINNLAVVVVIKNCPSIEKLYIRKCCKLTDAFVPYVMENAKRLITFSLRDCCKITYKSVEHLDRWNRVHEFQITVYTGYRSIEIMQNVVPVESF